MGTTVAKTIDVDVEEHDALPDGCFMRFAVLGPPRVVRHVRHDADDGVAGKSRVWRVEGRNADGTPAPAHAVPVDDSGAGTSLLVYGGEHGLRLHPEDGGDPVAEPYLLLAEDAIADEWSERSPRVPSQ